MKLGCCADIDQVDFLYGLGFDFIECPVSSLVPHEKDSKFQKVLTKFKNSPLPIEAFNILLPEDLDIVGPHINEDKMKDYINIALTRVKEVGANLVVFGSGNARSYPERFSKEEAKEQILSFLEYVVKVAESLNLTILIEPLNPKESNMIQTIKEAVDFAKLINHPHIQVVADFYHMQEVNESLNEIVKFKEFIKHIHVADTNRVAPGFGQYPYERFFKILRQINYSKRISIECHWQDFHKDVKQSKEFLDRWIAL